MTIFGELNVCDLVGLELIVNIVEISHFFRELADFVRSVDLQRRPVTLSVTVTDLDSHNLHTDYLDVVSLSYYTGRHDEPSKYREMVGVNGLNNTMLEIVERSWEKLRKPFVIADYGIVEVRIIIIIICFWGLRPEQ